MKRIYFLVPDIDVVKVIVDELLSALVERRHIHILAKRGTPLDDLQKIPVYSQADFPPSTERGLAIGAITGTLAGIAALAFPGGRVFGGEAIILGCALAGAGMGNWLSRLRGGDIGYSRLNLYEHDIEQGRFLLMVDVPKNRIPEMLKRIRKHHPEANFESTERTIPAFT